LLGSLCITGSSFGGLGNNILSAINGVVNPTTSGTSTYTPSQTQAAVDATTAANMTAPNPNPTAPDPSTIVTE